MKMINGDRDIYQYVASIEKCSDKSLHVKRKDPSRGESNDIGNSRNQQFVMAKLDGIGKVRSRDDFVYKHGIESRNYTLSGPSYLVDDIVPKKNLEQLMNRFFYVTTWCSARGVECAQQIYVRNLFQHGYEFSSRLVVVQVQVQVLYYRLRYL